MFTVAETAWKSELSNKNSQFSIADSYLHLSRISRQMIFNKDAVVLIMIIC